MRTTRTNQFTKGVTKTAITAAGMTGTVIGAYHVKNYVSDATDNSVLGIAAGIGTLLLGAAVVTGINKGVDKAFDVKDLSSLSSIQPLVIEVPDKLVPDDFMLNLDEEEADFLEQD